MSNIKRREFITLVGSAAAWPLAAGAQQPAMPVIGFLDSRSLDEIAGRLRALRQGLKETGYVDGETVTIVSLFADNQFDRLPELAAELVHRKVAVITTGGPPAAFAAKAATATIPTLFLVAEDPVRLGLVNSLARPGGNLTGINLFNAELAAKRLGLLHALVPRAGRIAVLVNPADTKNTEATLRNVEAGARAMGLQFEVLNADTGDEIDAAFEMIGRNRPDALFVGSSPFLNGRRVQLAQLAAFHRIPASYGLRECAEAGGLMSYGASNQQRYRQVGIYAGRILKGEKPADMPVIQPTKFELVINLPTARMIGIAVPSSLLAQADKVTE
jgi:putative tryptophan/tyrosine transport system substrate-binding protein